MDAWTTTQAPLVGKGDRTGRAPDQVVVDADEFD